MEICGKNNSVRKCAELYGNQCGKTSLFGNVQNCMEIGDKKTLHGNVRISDLVEIWFELASQLDLKCGEN